MSMKLYVGNLSFQTYGNDLQELFGQAGTVESASVVEDRETGRSRGFGFVEMSSKEEGEAAIAQFNGKAVYKDFVQSYSTVEPAIDLTASSFLAFSWQIAGAPSGTP